MKKTWFTLAILATVAVVFAGGMEMTSARLYKKQGEWLKSLQFYDTELQKNPTNGEAYFERGELLGEIAMDPGKSGLAQEIAGDATNPQRALIERMLSDFDKSKANADDKTAKRLAKKMNEITAEVWNTFYVNAVRHDSMVAYDKALEQADMAILLMPHDWRAFGLKAQILDKLEKPAEALNAWQSAHRYLSQSDWGKEKPEEYGQAMDIIHGRLLEGYYNSGQYDKTIEFADEVLKTRPGNPDAIQFKAFSLAQMASDTARNAHERDSLRAVAVAALNSARKDRPDYPPIVYTIGQFNLQLGDTVAAVAAFEDYLKLEPKDRDALFILGVIYLEGGSFINTEKARDKFKKITENDPDDGTAWINYGVALIRLGDNENGRKAIEKGKTLSSK